MNLKIKTNVARAFLAAAHLNRFIMLYGSMLLMNCNTEIQKCRQKYL